MRGPRVFIGQFEICRAPALEASALLRTAASAARSGAVGTGFYYCPGRSNSHPLDADGAFGLQPPAPLHRIVRSFWEVSTGFFWVVFGFAKSLAFTLVRWVFRSAIRPADGQSFLASIARIASGGRTKNRVSAGRRAARSCHYHSLRVQRRCGGRSLRWRRAPDRRRDAHSARSSMSRCARGERR